MQRVVIVGCGVVGAAIAYELSLCPGLNITVIDSKKTASGSTGAALGVAMAVISHKVKGRNWRLREQSFRRYPSLLSELERATGQPIQHNTQGILSLCFEVQEMPRWQSLQSIRQGQGYSLELWTPQQVLAHCPHLDLAGLVAGIYSPADLQVNPTQLTHALVTAAMAQGVEFYFDQPALSFSTVPTQDSLRSCTAVHTANHCLEADWVILAAGLGTTPLTQSLGQPTLLGPVLGQGIKIHLDQPLGDPAFQPVINGNDIHLVPLGKGEYWVGATVEFPPETDDSQLLHPEPERLADVLQGAIAYCPALAQGTITEHWFGLRPRPQGQAAPIIKPLEGFNQVLLATGHYRNGVLLAPATALAVRDHILSS